MLLDLAVAIGRWMLVALVDCVNGLIVAVAGALAAVFALLPALPAFPAPPDSGITAWIAWVFPWAGLLAVFGLFITVWIGWLAIRQLLGILRQLA